MPLDPLSDILWRSGSILWMTSRPYRESSEGWYDGKSAVAFSK